MQFTTYKITSLPRELHWTYQLYDKNNNPMYFKNVETLTVSGGGAVTDWEIDDDYLVCNNSKITIANPTTAVCGQIIALIDDSGAYHSGVIVSVDNKKRQILYKSLIELLNDNMINPMDENEQYDAINDTGISIAKNFTGENVDRFRRLPMVVRVLGGGKTGAILNFPAIWANNDKSINVKTWLLDLFDKFNIILNTRLVFEVDRAYIEMQIYQNNDGNFLIKNDVKAQSIQDINAQSATATVCDVVNKDRQFKARYYLLANNTVTEDSGNINRVQPFRLTVAEWDEVKSTTPPTTAKIVAEQALLYKDFSTFCKVKIDKDSKMYPRGIKFGDKVLLVPIIENMVAGMPLTDTSNHVIKTIYTGKKENSKKNDVELILGKIRVNYTDIIQIENQKKVRS